MGEWIKKLITVKCYPQPGENLVIEGLVWSSAVKPAWVYGTAKPAWALHRELGRKKEDGSRTFVKNVYNVTHIGSGLSLPYKMKKDEAKNLVVELEKQVPIHNKLVSRFTIENIKRIYNEQHIEWKPF